MERLLNETHALSITHIVDLQGGTKGDVVQPGVAAPHDDVAWSRIPGAREVAAESGDLDEIEREHPGRGRIGGLMSRTMRAHSRRCHSSYHGPPWTELPCSLSGTRRI